MTDLKEALVGMTTSKKPQINVAQYPRILSRILKGASHEEVFNYAVAEVVISRTFDDEAMKMC
jgi:hypothetical protein